ncbi:MAG: YdcH family protein [Oricola sp.]
MSIEAHLESLLRKHGVLESEISEAMSRPAPDQTELTQLKREKLRVKEEIERIRSETRH